jgi:hypothetical protein
MAETPCGSVHMWTAPDLQGLAWAACSDRLRSYVRPIFWVLRPLAKMGFADSEVQTRERHLLPVNRAEYLT